MLKSLATLIVVLLFAPGCIIANRSVLYLKTQKANTNGTITDNAKAGSASVAAEKTTEATTAVNTSSGTADAKQEAQK